MRIKRKTKFLFKCRVNINEEADVQYHIFYMTLVSLFRAKGKNGVHRFNCNQLQVKMSSDVSTFFISFLLK